MNDHLTVDEVHLVIAGRNHNVQHVFANFVGMSVRTKDSLWSQREIRCGIVGYKG